MISFLKVSGHSMMPYLSPGNIVVVISFLKLKKGDVVVFKHESKRMVKRIMKLQEDAVYVEGDNKNDSLDIGKIPKSDIIGKVFMKL